MRGLCSDIPVSEIDFCEPGSRRQKQRAKQICRQCPTQEQCLEAAFRNKESLGIWGGTDFDERKRDKRWRT